mmetsp:Transcript_22260/g.32379  ORF Transcript_22260/g.32379 Transcript_22260/m.32379 type:complete len:130 (-) Transcript_22260:43-432(-)
MYYRGQHNGVSRASHDRGSNGYSIGSNEQRAGEVGRTLLEQENDSRWLELGEQVSMLKSMTEDINQEVKSQINLLDSMGSNIMSASDMFSSTLGKLGAMMSSGGSGHMYLLIVFVVFIFVLIYFAMGRK